MTNQEKLDKAVKLLREVSANWNEDKVKHYPSTLLSFDELVEEIAEITVAN